MNSIRAIVERSSTIWERLDSDASLRGENPNPNLETVEFHLHKWIESTSSGDLDLFQERLAHENLTIENVRRALLPVHLPESETLPEWARTLEQWIESANYAPDPAENIPFSEVLTPVVDLAFSKLEDVSSDTFQFITKSARDQMKRQLMVILSSLCTPAIASELNLADHLKRLKGDTPQQRYRYFLKQKLGSSEALLDFLSDYPVLARIVALRIAQWIDGTAEFLNRLRSDLNDIENTFHEGKPVGCVAEWKESLSDPHHGGRSVKEIHFQNGLKVLYKPKDLGIDIAFVNIIRWLNQQEISPGLRTVRLLNKDKYGWAEFVAWEPCRNSEEVKQYYRRTGILLCLLYVLGASDSHRENIIAAGNSPVLVDMETLLRLPVAKGEAGAEKSAAQNALHIYEDSVMSTGLLPEWRFGAHGRPGVDVSGISGEAHQESPFLKTKWEGFDSGLIHADLRHPVLKQLSNQPALSGEPIHARDYFNDLVSGFEEMYRFLLKERDGFCLNPLFTDLCSKRVRYLNRPTKEYAMILDRSLDVESLRDGVTRSIRLDLLCRSLLNRKRDNVWQLLASERAALEKLDIPYFTTRANSTSLRFDNGNEAINFFETSAGEFLMERFRRLSPADMNQQISWIRGSFAARYDTVKSQGKEFRKWQEQEPMTREELLGEAAEIANRLIAQAIRSSDGSVTWMGIEFIPSVEQYQLQPMSVGLYGGISGVALFFSALHHFLPDSEFSDVARRAIQTIQWQRTNTRPNELMRQCGLGGMTGVASVAYSLAWSSRLLKDASITNEAMTWAHRITKDAIHLERSLDFLSGIAGTISALLRLYKWNGDENLLARAIDCAHRLIPVSSQMKMAGFSHGASGIGHALLQLYEASKDKEFYDAALLTLQNETLRETASWCNGAPGIALSRLAAAPMFDREIEAGIHVAKNHGVSDVDHLCCGNCGRIDILLTAGKRLSQNDLFEAANRQMSAIVRRAKVDGAFHLMNGDPSQICNAGLLKGLAGIGYTCLRLADVENVLPSILLME